MPLAPRMNSVVSNELDQVLSAQAAERLGSSGYGALQAVRCRAEAGTVELSGTVPTFFLKQLAQSLVSGLPAVRGVRNLLEVRA
jgi:osmotically-inducible protein OsmY